MKTILYYKIQSVCVIVCMSMWNRLPNHAHYGDEPFAGDSVGLGLGQRLNFISKKVILRYFWGKIAPDEKILFTSRAGPALIYFYMQQILLKSKQRLITTSLDVGCKVAAMYEKHLQETTSIPGSQELTNMGIIAAD